MKKFYTLICAGLLLSLTSSAQFTGGTYTAVQPGHWVPVGSEAGIWATGNPPVQCNNCLVNLAIPGGGTIVMNSQLVLTGGSILQIGPNVTLQFAVSAATSFINPANQPNYVIMTDQQSNRIQLVASTSVIQASGLETPANGGTGGGYDGVYTASGVGTPTTVLLKQLGSAPNQFTNDNITSNGPAIYGTVLVGANTLNNFGSLPIVLSSFTATLDQDVVNLDWTTTTEVNADHIAVQRSADAGAHWATIGTEAAKNTTGTPTNYSYADAKPLGGASEYRLQLVDKDGKYTYSQVKTIRNGLIGAVSVFPNPAHDYVNVTLGGNASESLLVRLYNQSGQLLQLRNVSNGGGTTVSLSVSGYPVGNYLIVVNGADGAKQVSNLLISK